MDERKMIPDGFVTSRDRTPTGRTRKAKSPKRIPRPHPPRVLPDPPRQHVPTPQTRAQVEALASYAMNHTAIAEVIGCSVEVLEKRYKVELDVGPEKATAKVAQAMLTNALKGSVEAQKFWLTRRGKWQEPPKAVDMTVGGTGPGGAISLVISKEDMAL